MKRNNARVWDSTRSPAWSCAVIERGATDHPLGVARPRRSGTLIIRCSANPGLGSGTCWALAANPVRAMDRSWGADLPRVADFSSLRLLPSSRLPADLICGVVRTARRDGAGFSADTTLRLRRIARSRPAQRPRLCDRAGTQVSGVMEFSVGGFAIPIPIAGVYALVGTRSACFCPRSSAQEALRESEERFFPPPRWCDRHRQLATDGRFMFTNRWLCELLGYTRKSCGH